MIILRLWVQAKILLHSEDSETRLIGVQIPSLSIYWILLLFSSAFWQLNRHPWAPKSGGGFAAGVAGATSISLLMVSGRLQRIEDSYSRSNAAVVEKFAVVAFILIAMMSFTSVIIPASPFSFIPQNIYIPILNVVAGLKVTIGAWSVIRLFITKRGII